LLTSKKQELGELLKQQNSSNTTAKPSDKVGLYVGCGIIAVVLVILVRRSKKSK